MSILGSFFTGTPGTRQANVIASEGPERELGDLKYKLLMQAKPLAEAEIPGITNQQFTNLAVLNARKNFLEQQGDLATQERTLQGSAEDARRRLASLAAARGLGRSSIGLSQDVAIQKDLGEQLARLRGSKVPLGLYTDIANTQAGIQKAQEQERIQDKYLQRLLSLAGQSPLTPNRVDIFEAPGRAGILPLAGTLAGAAIGSKGGAQGAAYGAQIGGGAGQGLASLFGGR